MNTKNYLVIEAPMYNHKYSIKLLQGITADKFSQALDETWQATGSDVLYFFPGCNVPRFKVREKFKITTKPEKATAMFISTESKGSDMIQLRKGMMNVDIYKEPILEWVLEKNLAPFVDRQNDVKLYKSLINNIQIDHILLDVGVYETMYTYNYNNDSMSEHLMAWLKIRGLASENYVTDREHSAHPLWSGYHFHKFKGKNPENVLITWNNTFSKLAESKKLYPESDILSVLNDDQIVIDYEKFEELCSWFGSNDPENILLAAEMMANSNFKKSGLYLLQLLSNYRDKLKMCKGTKHVNFKSLLSYFGYQLNERKRLNSNRIIEILTTKGIYDESVGDAYNKLITNDTYFGLRE